MRLNKLIILILILIYHLIAPSKVFANMDLDNLDIDITLKERQILKEKNKRLFLNLITFSEKGSSIDREFQVFLSTRDKSIECKAFEDDGKEKNKENYTDCLKLHYSMRILLRSILKKHEDLQLDIEFYKKINSEEEASTNTTAHTIKEILSKVNKNVNLLESRLSEIYYNELVKKSLAQESKLDYSGKDYCVTTYNTESRKLLGLQAAIRVSLYYGDFERFKYKHRNLSTAYRRFKKIAHLCKMNEKIGYVEKSLKLFPTRNELLKKACKNLEGTSSDKVIEGCKTELLSPEFSSFLSYHLKRKYGY